MEHSTPRKGNPWPARVRGGEWRGGGCPTPSYKVRPSSRSGRRRRTELVKLGPNPSWKGGRAAAWGCRRPAGHLRQKKGSDFKGASIHGGARRRRDGRRRRRPQRPADMSLTSAPTADAARGQGQEGASGGQRRQGHVMSATRTRHGGAAPRPRPLAQHGGPPRPGEPSYRRTPPDQPRQNASAAFHVKFPCVP